MLAWFAKGASSFKINLCSLSEMFNFIESKLMTTGEFSLVNRIPFVKTAFPEAASIGRRTGFAASLPNNLDVMRHLYSLRPVLSTAGQISSMSISSKGTESNTEKTEDIGKEEGNSNLMLWPVKVFLVYGFLVLSYKLWPQMSDSIVISGLKLCQRETDSSFHLIGLQRVRFYLHSQEVCKKLFPSDNNTDLNLADVLSRSLSCIDQAVQDEALALIEKVIDIWPESIDHLKKAGIAAILDNRKGLKLDGERDEIQQKVVRILAALSAD